MASNLITKFATVFVVLILTLCVCAPVVSSIATTTETVTVETEYGANTIDSAVYGSISSYKVGVEAEYDTVRCANTSPYSEDPTGSLVRYSARTLTNMTAYIGDNKSFITTSNLSTFVDMTLGTDITTYPATVTVNGWGFTFTRNADNNSIIEVTTTVTNDGALAYIYLPYDVTYNAPTVLTYGTNSIHNLVLTDSVGTVSGTPIVFTPTAGGDYLSIPLHILTDNQSTYYVKSGDTYYAPGLNGEYVGFVAPSTSGVNSAITLTFTASQTYTGVYELTGSSTDTDLTDIIIPLNVTQTATVNPVASQILTFKGASFIVDTNHNLWVCGDNSDGRLGLGNTTNVDTWTLSKTNVKKVACAYNSNATTYVIDTNDNLWVTGFSHSSNFLYFYKDSSSTSWVDLQITDVADVCATGAGALYVTNTDGVLYGSYQYSNSVAQIDGYVSQITATFNNGLAYLTTGGTFCAGQNPNAMSTISTGVTSYATNQRSTFYVDSTGDLYAYGSNGIGQLGTGDTTDVPSSTPVKVASNVSKVYISEYDSSHPTYISSYYISTTGDLYSTGLNANGQLGLGNSTDATSWTDTGFDNATDVYVGYLSVLVKDNTGKLYGAGGNALRQLGGGLEYNKLETLTETATGVLDVSIKCYGGYPCTLIAKSTGVYTAGSDFSHQIPASSSTWDIVALSSSTTVVTNTVETETVSDLRGTVAGTPPTFTPAVDGDYLYVPILDFDTYTYYVSYGSTVYAPDLSGNALASHIVPDTTGIYADLTITLTQLPGYNGQIYSVTGSSTDTDEVGIAIPYTVTYNGYADTHYDYNELYDGKITYYYWTDANGSYLYIPGDVLKENPAYVNAADVVYGEDAYGDVIATLDVSAIVDLTITRDTLIDPNEINGEGTGFIIVPVAYTGGTNDPATEDRYVYAVRGTVNNNIFTESADGDYLSIPIPVLVENTYHIGKGKVYYPVNMNDAHFSQTAPLTSLVNSSLHLTFTADADKPTLYELTATSSDLSLGAVWIPYVATYDVTETITHELIPMASVIVMVVILLAIVVAVGGILRIKGGHF